MKPQYRSTIFAFLLPCVALVAATPACVSDDNDLQFGTTKPDAGDIQDPDAGPSEDAGPSPHVPEHLWTECQASDQAWVRRAMVALTGRKPWGQAEVKTLADTITAIRKADLMETGTFGELGGVLPPTGEDLVRARKIVAEIIMRDDAFRLRWSDFFMDALRVVRIETKSLSGCYGSPNATLSDGGTLAAWVRDNDSANVSPPTPNFTMNALLQSALELDDLSPVYRAHLFAMMSKPYDAANVGPLELERARRQNFGAVFERSYLNRDRVCLVCHNSEYAVTADDDPLKNRHWPVPGLFEQALYGTSAALHPPDEAATKGSDELRALSMLRFGGVADANGQAPFGWDGGACGRFKTPTEDDPLGVDTYFGSIRSTPTEPNRGRRASVWDLERSLHKGFDSLAADGLDRLPNNVLADPDEAFAYLVAQNIVDEVWSEVMGNRLTIATHFPRTQMQRDTLQQLTERFVASHFSLKTLLADILAHPLFNLKAPEEGCGNAAYELPRILNPWSNAEKDVTRQENSPGDAVFAMSSRPLRRSLYWAMEWPEYAQYPEGTEQVLQTATGFFLKDGEPGFRGLDFQGRLVWEATFGVCSAKVPNDFVAKVVTRALATSGATYGDIVIALKDRFVGEPWLEPTKEKPLIGAMFGVNLDDTMLNSPEIHARRYCGVLVSSPQFMLGGSVAKDTDQMPKIQLPERSYTATCNKLIAVASQLAVPYTFMCSAGTITATKM